MKRHYPFPAYPNGWFQVAYSDELQPGGVMPLSYFGRELVLFRGSDGKASGAPRLRDVSAPSPMRNSSRSRFAIRVTRRWLSACVDPSTRRHRYLMTYHWFPKAQVPWDKRSDPL